MRRKKSWEEKTNRGRKVSERECEAGRWKRERRVTGQCEEWKGRERGMKKGRGKERKGEKEELGIKEMREGGRRARGAKEEKKEEKRIRWKDGRQ